MLTPIFKEEGPPPQPLTVEERDRLRNTSEKRKENKRAYRHDNSMWQSNASYLTRPIVAYDGEGVTLPGTSRGEITESTTDQGEHVYVMLACKSSDGDGDYVADEKGLGTSRIFDFAIASAERNPTAIHVIYGGSYDFNMWLRDIGRPNLERVYRRKYFVWNGYRIGWRRGKSFYVCKVDEDGEKIGVGVTIFDVVSFFQRSFVKACDQYLGETGWTDREMIVSNKALRSSFHMADIPVMRTYNDAELVNLIALVTELRDRLNKVGLRPRRWDGPGAVASALLQREGVKEAMAVCPEPVAEAARFAYAGGRFEVVRFGHVEQECYEYDVNSAYPSALRSVPDLSRGSWTHDIGYGGSHVFALYHIRASAFRLDVPGPLFRRDANGTVCYPQTVTGWYWSPEMKSTKAYCEAGWGEYEVIETWVFRPTTDKKPFEFVEGLYRKRLALKRGGDGAQVGIKLALNSLYGKCCQQVGWERKDDGTIRIPPFHQLEWAGYATSHCRAEVLMAALGDLESVIAFETDAVFTSAPLPGVELGENIGEFEQSTFRDLTYLQSGLYFADGERGDVTSKTRGVDRGQLERKEVLRTIGNRLAEDRAATVTLTRFVGVGVALAQSFDRWRRWETVTKTVGLEPSGKREHFTIGCGQDGDGSSGDPFIRLGVWHYTFCGIGLHDRHSAEFPVEWINPDPDMNQLSDLRSVQTDWEGEEA